MPSRVCTWFSKNWPYVITFDPTGSSVAYKLDFIELNILAKFYEDRINTVPSREYAMFFYYLTY